MIKEEGEEVSGDKPVLQYSGPRRPSRFWIVLLVAFVVVACAAFIAFRWVTALGGMEAPNAGD